mmetsp:Transcript_25408/g.28213  ORF Transcript_25408/g.28213 Transcript_25408/m.28213 type:complete len:392 (-) Transcript_25408:13-1188(-)|eukprot:CAMPEP_0205818584 /NCGR_PEP_ID=MMETSP0206-20130828/524_1 /ASSEMBLY_ACC=CAM_ASM_000279 /TAXON_ID=36767 /ORGANISM="Euplotes focardii, Strain TN1" /LENGTH=391 /DNA_ID=CAMNT_0053111061 /DNA_START=21 /DNA_END=1196 /DNA_ORIENTATION=+
MKVLSSLLCLAVATATANLKSLVEVAVVGGPEFARLQSVLPERDQLESLTETTATMWVTDAELFELRVKGFNVTTGVTDWTSVNAEEAFRRADSYMGHKASGEPDWTQFCGYLCMRVLLQGLENRCDNIMDLTSVGKTGQSRDIWVMRVSSGDRKPQVLLAGNIHGDETTGGQLLQRFLWDICDKYGTDDEITRMVDSTDLYVMPMLNADGYERRRRGNAQGRDLNRDFPNTWTSPPGGTRQVETTVFKDFVESKEFKLSLMMHGGAVVANYPYDSREPGTRGYSATSRDSEVVAIAKLYADNHRNMHESRRFPGGIVNGAMWYIIFGSLQDYMFDYNDKCIDITLEVSQIKWPAGRTLPGHYTDNYNSLVAFTQAHTLLNNSSKARQAQQ